MNHKHKTLLFKFLDVLSNRLGYFIYHKLQDAFAGQSTEFKLNATQKSFETMLEILEKNGVTIEKKVVAEIGSGWLPILPYCFVFRSGATLVNTYDINRHYEKSKIEELNSIFCDKFSIDAECFDGDYALPSKVQYFPHTNICNADLSQTDLIVSRFVLEHVSPQDIVSMHQHFYEKLKKGAYILHLISPSDHRAYTDNSISLYDFLKYSEEEWNAIQTKFDYHNRLRLPQYIDLFQDKFEIVYLDYDFCQKGSKQEEMFKQLVLHKSFSSYTFEELTAGAINVLLKVK